MKWFLILWFAPVSLIIIWYGLSYNDVGLIFFSREVHDMTFKMYGDILGIPPDAIPPLLFRALAVDSLIVFSIVAFRYRKTIAAWIGKRQESYSEPVSEKEDILSSAP